LKWLFEDPNNVGWVKPSGSMLGNGFCWGQLSHTLAWIYKVTGLTPASVFAFLTNSEITGADIYATIGVQCACGAKITISGTACQPAPDGENKKHVDNLIVGTKGTVRYHGVMDHGGASGEKAQEGQGSTVWRFSDGREEFVEGFEFENLETGVGERGGRGPESVHAFVDGCLGKPCFVGADAEVGFKAVATLDAIYRSARSGQAEAVRCL
jgi:predicted dehydrogenase